MFLAALHLLFLGTKLSVYGKQYCKDKLEDENETLDYITDLAVAPPSTPPPPPPKDPRKRSPASCISPKALARVEKKVNETLEASRQCRILIKCKYIVFFLPRPKKCDNKNF